MMCQYKKNRRYYYRSFSCFVSTWYACISSFFTSGFAGTLAIRPWFRIHDIQSHRWKHEHNVGGINNQMAMQGESFVPMFGEIRMVSVWCVMAFPFFGVLWQNYLVAWTASPGKGQHVEVLRKMSAWKTVESRWVLDSKCSGLIFLCPMQHPSCQPAK